MEVERGFLTDPDEDDQEVREILKAITVIVVVINPLCFVFYQDVGLVVSSIVSYVLLTWISVAEGWKDVVSQKILKRE